MGKTASKGRKSKKPKRAKKDGPFPLTKVIKGPLDATKDGPFPMWTRISPASVAKDGPFPMLAKDGLYWERIPFQTLYQGNRGPKKLTTIVAHSKPELLNALPDIKDTGIDADNINFAKDEVIIVGLGERPDNGSLVQIDQILYFTDRLKGRGPLTSISYGEHRTTGILDVLTYPVHVVKSRRLDGEVQFSQT
ncbi:MAG TPA: hypothetical protein VJA94_10095 [Candidatus Angelobacter sp.]